MTKLILERIGRDLYAYPESEKHHAEQEPKRQRATTKLDRKLLSEECDLDQMPHGYMVFDLAKPTISDRLFALAERISGTTRNFVVDSCRAYANAPGRPESETDRMARVKVANDARFRVAQAKRKANER